MDAAPAYGFSDAESALLSDGRAVVLRPVTPASRLLIAAAMSHLSPESSRRRFFTPRFRLSDAELDRLTNLDGVDRYAIGATVASADGSVEGIGVARYTREPDEPRAAEAAVVVIDAYQGLGLGSQLLGKASKKLKTVRDILAEVQRINPASIKIFEQNNFERYKEDKEYYYYKLKK